MHYDVKESDILDFANWRGIRIKQHGDEITFDVCPYCNGGSERKDRGTFSVNRKTGQFKCMRASCGVEGNMITLARDFDFKLTDDFSNYYRKRPSYKRLPQPEKKIVPKPPAVEFLSERGISEDTAKAYQVTVRNDDEGILVFPIIDENGKMVNVKYRNLRFTPDKKNGIKEWFEPGCMPYLYGIQAFNGSYERMVLYEGQLDALSGFEAGVENSFSVPGGAKGFTWWPPSYEFASKFEEIIIFGDYENGQITLLEEMKQRYGGILKHVRKEDYKDCKDANEILLKYGKEQVAKCVENAVMLPIADVVELADVPDVDISKLEKLSTGIKQVDKLLYGGLPFGGVHLIAGKPGSGKLLANDTPVFTDKGWKRHGDLRVGDRVIGRNGQYTTVKHVFPKYFANMKVTFENGESVKCHENHEWMTTTTILETKEIYERLHSGKRSIELIPREATFGELKRNPIRNFITSVEYCEPVQGNCIEVEGGVYCIGKTMVPTHNSTLSSQILVVAISEGYKCFAYSGELPNYLFKAWINYQIAGGNHVYETGDGIHERFGYGISKANRNVISEWYRGKAYIYDNSSIDSSEHIGLLEAVEKSVQRYGCRVVLIDNLMTALDMESVRGDDKYDKQSHFVKQLTRLALRYNILILLVAHKRKNNVTTDANDEISGSGDIANLGMITLAYDRNTKPNEPPRLIRVAKNRLFGKVNNEGFKVDFDERSKRIYGEGDDPNREYGCFNDQMDGFTPIPDDFDEPNFD